MATVEAPIEPLARTGTLPPRYIADPHRYRRRPTRVVMVGDVGVGGHHPIRVQSMTTTDTMDTDATVAQTVRLVDAGCEIVRITAPTVEDARNIGAIRRILRARGIRVPLVADIHFSPAAALEAADHVEKVRINPGNFADSKRFAVREYSDAQYVAELGRIEERFAPLVMKCKAGGVAMRIGTNHGSLSDRIMNRFGDTPLGMVESALEFVHICGRYDYHDVIFSMKASNPKVMIQAYRLLAARLDALGLDYPFHLGVTEAGNGEDGRIKSAIGIGSLLEDGIGDTIRVSLTEDPEYEVPVAFALARPYQPDPSATDRSAALDRPRATETPPPAETPPAPTAIYGYDPYAYTRRASRPIALGTMALGGGQPVRVVQSLPGELATVPQAVERARALAGADGLVRARPDALAVTVHTADDVAALRTLRVALDSAQDTPVESADSAEASPPLALVACVTPGVPQLDAIARDVDAICLAVPWDPGVSEHTGDTGVTGDSRELPEGDGRDAGATLRAALQTIAGARRPLLLEVTPPGADAPPASPRASETTRAETAVTRLMQAATSAEEAGCRDIALSVCARQTGLALRTYRRLAARLAAAGKDYPLHLVAWPDGESGAVLLRAAVLLGALLCDGIGDGVHIRGVQGLGSGSALPADGARARLAFNILQGAGVRLSKTEFVACPSCGRTLFDLQETTERIQHKTGHLKGVKIAIMGCIVNGPGEMADADFGYVGGAPGRVNLYVGKECIEKGVPAGTADDRLIELIRRHDKWVDPPPSA